MSVYDPCTQKIKAVDDLTHLLSTTISIDSLVNISSHMQQKMQLILFFLLIYFLYLSALKLNHACVVSIMDSTQDSGSWNVGSTPTRRIDIFTKSKLYVLMNQQRAYFYRFTRIILYKSKIIFRVLPKRLSCFLFFHTIEDKMS